MTQPLEIRFGPTVPRAVNIRMQCGGTVADRTHNSSPPGVSFLWSWVIRSESLKRGSGGCVKERSGRKRVLPGLLDWALGEDSELSPPEVEIGFRPRKKCRINLNASLPLLQKPTSARRSHGTQESRCALAHVGDVGLPPSVQPRGGKTVRCRETYGLYGGGWAFADDLACLRCPFEATTRDPRGQPLEEIGPRSLRCGRRWKAEAEGTKRLMCSRSFLRILPTTPSRLTRSRFTAKSGFIQQVC